MTIFLCKFQKCTPWDSCNATQSSGGIDNAGIVERLCCHGANVHNRDALWITKVDDITSDTPLLPRASLLHGFFGLRSVSSVR